MPRRPKADTLPLHTRPRRKPREPRLPKGTASDHQYHDTVRVITAAGTVEYTDAVYQLVEGNLLAVFGTRNNGTVFAAALYNTSTWQAVVTIPQPVVAPV